MASPEAMPNHVTIERVTKRFGATTALNDISLTIGKGEFLTLLGPSGCGKTTLLHTVAGFIQHDGGSIVVGGRSVDGVPPHRRNFGMVFQNYAVFPHMSVFDNVAYGLRARNIDRATIETKVMRALDRVRLKPLAQRFPDAMSGGQKQRVGLARAMVIEPDILLMDEPLSNLDAKLRVEMRQEIRLMQRELGITALYVTHDQEEAMAVSDRIAVMERGEIRQVGAPEVIFEDPTHAFVADFIGGANWLEGDAMPCPDGGGTMIVLPGGTKWSVDRAIATQAIRAAIRTDELRLADAGDDASIVIEGRVLMRSYLGQRTRLHLLLVHTDLQFSADLPSRLPLPAEGDTVRLAIDPANVRLFSAADSRRLA